MPIREMGPGDIPEVVAIHLESFPGFFLSFLGPKFLALLYAGVMDHPQGLVLVSESASGIEGFVAGVTDQSGFYKRLIKKRVHRFAWASFGAVVRRPRVAPRLIRALGQSRRSEESAAKASLMSIAVRPGTSGKGAGRQLVSAFNAALAARGVREYCLTTDRDANDRVNEFYRRLGFRLAGSFVTPEGRAMNEYVMTLGGEKISNP
ncbi:MAG: GNAT family N-acetyltransferase [Candidatus Aminicenantales bacterium]